MNQSIATFKLLLLSISLILCSTLKARQDANTATDIAIPDSLTVEVDKVVKDEDIQKRLDSIIQASGWFDQARISVNEGIVVLEGQTSQDKYSAWAESLASKTDGVVAVINKIDLNFNESWSLQPAADEATSMFKAAIRALPLIVSGLVVLLITYLLAKLITSLTHRVLQKRISNTFILKLTARMLAIPVIVIGLYLILRLTGLTQLAVTVIGGTGLLGLIIGIAFRDIVENFLASILISLQRPFSIGDIITVDSHKGVVQSVTTRGTIIMTLDGDHVHIPNSTIYKSVIVNLTANPNTRMNFLVGIGYDDNIAEAQQIISDIFSQHEAILDQPEPLILIENLGASTINIRAYFWVDNEKHSPAKVRSAVIRLTKRAFDNAGVSMPDEAREVVFPDGIEVTSRNLPADEKPKQLEPLESTQEQNLSSEVEDIQKQYQENPLAEEEDNLLK